MASNNFVTFLGALNVGSSPRIEEVPRPAPLVDARGAVPGGEAYVIPPDSSGATPIRNFPGAIGPAAPAVDVEFVGKQVLSLLAKNRLPVQAIAGELNLQIEQLRPVLDYLSGAHMIDSKEDPEGISFGLTEFASDALQVFHMA